MMAPGPRAASVEIAGQVAAAGQERGASARLVRVEIGGQRFGIRARDIIEIVRPPPLTRVPMAPAALAGLVNLRGDVVPVVRLAHLLGEAASGGQERLVVVERPDRVAIAVDRVGALTEEGAEGVAPLPLEALLAQAFGSGRDERAGGGVPHRPPAAARPDAGTTTRREAILCFTLADQTYGLPLEVVLGVCAAPAQMPRPSGLDDAVEGVVEFRGEPITVVCPDRLLGLRARYGGRQQIVAIRFGDAALGLLVDRVDAIRRVDATQISKAPALLNRAGGDAHIAAIARTDCGLVALLAPALLGRDAPTDQAPRAAAEQEAGTEARLPPERILVFRLGRDRYALPVAAVREVIRNPASMTRVPHGPPFLVGVMNHRGDVLPVVDQQMRFRANHAAPLRDRRVIVSRVGDVPVGFAVDAVEAVRAVGPEELAAAPDLAVGEGGLFDRAIRSGPEGRPLLLLEPAALLGGVERDLLAAVAAGAIRGGAA